MTSCCSAQQDMSCHTFAARSPSFSTNDMTILAAIAKSTISTATRAATSHSGIDRAASIEAFAIASDWPGVGEMSGTRKLCSLNVDPLCLVLHMRSIWLYVERLLAFKRVTSELRVCLTLFRISDATRLHYQFPECAQHESTRFLWKSQADISTAFFDCESLARPGVSKVKSCEAGLLWTLVSA